MWEIKFNDGDIKYIIKTLDSSNITTERFDPGGELIPKGRYKGQLSQPKWITLGYHGSFEQACTHIVNTLYMELPNHIENILELVKTAKVTLIEKVKNG